MLKRLALSKLAMNLARVEGRLFVISAPVGVDAYDFDFDLHFRCEHPFRLEREEPCVLRVGAIADYAAEFRERLEMSLRLVNTPDEHLRASELEHWYPLIPDLTPRSKVFEALPTVAQVEAAFDWPVFVKGSRQTSRHHAQLSVISNADEYDLLLDRYAKDDILRWQKPVVREFVPLMAVAGNVPCQVRPSLELRSFWWRGDCVGWGRYWYQVPPYDIRDAGRGLDVAREAASRLCVPFLVVDVAKTADGRWIVIECNDAQESGYAGVVPKAMWERVLSK